MMTARDDTSTRPRKFNIMALLLAGSALGIAGCAQQRTEGYYDPPAESTVTDAQSQAPAPATAPSCAHRRKCRSRSSPTPPQDREPAGPGRASGHTTEDGQPCPKAPTAAPRLPGARPRRPCRHPRPAPPRTASCRNRRPWVLPCFSPAMQCTAQRVTLTLAPTALARPRRLPGKRRQAGRAGGRARLLGRHRRTPVARDPAGRQGQRARRIAAAANNVLRVRSIAGQTPNLNYNLTRQPDLDPIDELAKAAAPQCP